MIFLALLYFLLSLVILPLSFFIDIILNISRKDLKIFIREKYFPFSGGHPLYEKHFKAYKKKYIVIATSAGEVTTFLKIADDYCLYTIFVTSITGRHMQVKNNNIKLCYLPADTIFTVLHYFFKIRCEAILIIEHEIWPAWLFLTKLFKRKIMLLQARQTLFAKKSFIVRLWNSFMAHMFSLVHYIDTPESIPHYLKRYTQKILYGHDIKLFDSPEYPINKNSHFTLVFASTHPQEENIYYNALQTLLTRSGNIFSQIYIVPRHPNRAEEILNTASSAFNNLPDIDIVLFSSIEEQKLKSHEYTAAENNDIGIQSSNTITHLNNLDAKESIAANPEQLLQHYRFDKTKKAVIVVVDSFGLLKKIYAESHIAIVSATFKELGGGHNIFEPLLYHNYCIAGLWLHNLKAVFNNAVTHGLASYAEDYSLADTIMKFVDKIQTKAVYAAAFNDFLKIYTSSKQQLMNAVYRI